MHPAVLAVAVALPIIAALALLGIFATLYRKPRFLFSCCCRFRYFMKDLCCCWNLGEPVFRKNMNWIDQHVLLGGMPTSRADLAYLARKHNVACVMSVQERYELPPCFDAEVKNAHERRRQRKALASAQTTALLRDRGGIARLHEMSQTSLFENTGVVHDLGMVHVNRATPDWTVLPLKSLAYCVATLMLYASHDRKVYLHCRRGQGRSGTVAVAYMCVAHGLRPDEAEAQVKSIRPSLKARTRANWAQIHEFVNSYWNSPAGYAVRKRVIDTFNSAGFKDHVAESSRVSQSQSHAQSYGDDGAYSQSEAYSQADSVFGALDAGYAEREDLLPPPPPGDFDSDNDEDDEIPPPPPPMPFDARSVIFLGDDDDIPPPPPPPRPGMIPVADPDPPAPAPQASAGGFFGFFGGAKSDSEDEAPPPPAPPIPANGAVIADEEAPPPAPSGGGFFGSLFGTAPAPPAASALPPKPKTPVPRPPVATDDDGDDDDDDAPPPPAGGSSTPAPLTRALSSASLTRTDEELKRGPDVKPSFGFKAPSRATTPAPAVAAAEAQQQQYESAPAKAESSSSSSKSSSGGGFFGGLFGGDDKPASPEPVVVIDDGAAPPPPPPPPAPEQEQEQEQEGGFFGGFFGSAPPPPKPTAPAPIPPPPAPADDSEDEAAPPAPPAEARRESKKQSSGGLFGGLFGGGDDSGDDEGAPPPPPPAPPAEEPASAGFGSFFGFGGADSNEPAPSTVAGNGEAPPAVPVVAEQAVPAFAPPPPRRSRPTTPAPDSAEARADAAASASASASAPNYDYIVDQEAPPAAPAVPAFAPPPPRSRGQSLGPPAVPPPPAIGGDDDDEEAPLPPPPAVPAALPTSAFEPPAQGFAPTPSPTSAPVVPSAPAWEASSADAFAGAGADPAAAAADDSVPPPPAGAPPANTKLSPAEKQAASFSFDQFGDVEARLQAAMDHASAVSDSFLPQDE